MLNLFVKGIKILFANIKAYNFSLNKNEILSIEISDKSSLYHEILMDLNTNSNKKLNKLFNIAKIASSITFDLANINL